MRQRDMLLSIGRLQAMPVINETKSPSSAVTKWSEVAAHQKAQTSRLRTPGTANAVVKKTSVSATVTLTGDATVTANFAEELLSRWFVVRTGGDDKPGGGDALRLPQE